MNELQSVTDIDEVIKYAERRAEGCHQMASSYHTDEGVFLQEETRVQYRAIMWENIHEWLEELKELRKKQRPHGEWIPIKLRPMTEEEVKEQEEKWGWTLDDNEKFMFDCPLPDEGQEILVCYSWGHVAIDRCEYDPDCGYGLEENGDWDGVLAWMPLPEPYKEEGERNEQTTD